MPRLPVITGKKLADFLEKEGFVFFRQNGSHLRYKHPDGRVTTVPIHGNNDLPIGLLRKIIRNDLKLNLDEFLRKWENY